MCVPKAYTKDICQGDRKEHAVLPAEKLKRYIAATEKDVDAWLQFCQFYLIQLYLIMIIMEKRAVCQCFYDMDVTIYFLRNFTICFKMMRICLKPAVLPAVCIMRKGILRKRMPRKSGSEKEKMPRKRQKAGDREGRGSPVSFLLHRERLFHDSYTKKGSFATLTLRKALSRRDGRGSHPPPYSLGGKERTR